MENDNPNSGRAEGDNEVDADIEGIKYPVKNRLTNMSREEADKLIEGGVIYPFDGKPNFDDLDEITKDKLISESEEAEKDWKAEAQEENE